MRKILLLFAFFINAFALSTSEILSLYDSGQYRQVCSNAVEKFFKENNDEAVINMYASSCLKIHEINRLSTPIFKLVRTKSARENAAYFADILFKKKLLYHAVIDDVDISYIRLPRSDYILSMIFDKFVKKEYEKDGDVYVFKEPNSDTYYELAKSDDEVQRLILRIYKNDDVVSEIEYW